VNFFGHAAVASWSSDEASVALGAMLPDFESMSGARVAATPDAAVAAGIALHHATDAAFHRLPAVTALMRELDERLSTRGCARGPRRAVAHIGVELLLDGVLVGEPAYRAAYTRALALDADLVWRDPGDPLRFVGLLERLRAYGVPDDLRHPDAIAQRLARILARRPLLAPSAADLRAIRAALAEHQARVEAAAETVLRGTRAALEREQEQELPGAPGT
jgi:acyl carrier protein phosphodiesterase